MLDAIFTLLGQSHTVQSDYPALRDGGDESFHAVGSAASHIEGFENLGHRQVQLSLHLLHAAENMNGSIAARF